VSQVEQTSFSIRRPAADRVPGEYKAWLIDLDGTLYRHQCVRIMMAFELLLLGRSTIKILRTFRHEQERLRAAVEPCRSDPFQLQIDRTAESLEIPRSHVEAIVDKWMFVRPGRWLRAFRRQGFLRAISQYRTRGGKTALVSDYPARHKLAAMQTSDLFDVVIACGESGGPCGLKPDPSGLLLASEQLQVSAGDCLVIGDRYQVDDEAAYRARMDFRHINSFRAR
jgi:FMN phosphatase YigB (HAD superfamily)